MASEFDISKIGLLERMRLQQEQWHGPNGTQRLAELLSTFLNNPEVPITTNQPMTFNVGQGIAPVVFRNLIPENPPLFDFRDQHGNQVGTVNWNPNTGLESKDPDGKVLSQPGTGGGGGGDDEEDTTTEQVVFAGKVLSGGGTSYLCRLYPNGPDEEAAATPETVRVLQLDDDLPADSWLIVIKTGSVYCAQPAIFYAPGA